MDYKQLLFWRQKKKEVAELEGIGFKEVDKGNDSKWTFAKAGRKFYNCSTKIGL